LEDLIKERPPTGGTTAMNKAFVELPGWTFQIDEVSAGVYEAIGTDGFGHRVVAEGLDPDELLRECRESAMRIGRYDMKR
jgi:hypothetical protein